MTSDKQTNAVRGPLGLWRCDSRKSSAIDGLPRGPEFYGDCFVDGRKIFSSDELDERGELPPPFNLERYNFNGHDVRGYFDRDPKTGEEIMKNLKRDK